MRVAGERWTSSAGRSAAPRRSPGDTTKRGTPPAGGAPRGRAGSAGEVEQRPGVARVPQLRQRLLLELTDPLAGQAEVLADLVQRARGAVVEAEAHRHDLLFAGRQHAQGEAELVGHELPVAQLGRLGRVGVLDEVTDAGLAVLADRGVEADRLAAGAQ